MRVFLFNGLAEALGSAPRLCLLSVCSSGRQVSGLAAESQGLTYRKFTSKFTHMAFVLTGSHRLLVGDIFLLPYGLLTTW